MAPGNLLAGSGNLKSSRLAGSVSGISVRLAGWKLPDDGRIMRAMFYLLVLAIGIGLIHDYRQLVGQNDRLPAIGPVGDPVLPAYVPQIPGIESPLRVAPDVTADPQLLRNPLKTELGSGGMLNVTGSIDPGSSARFAAEIGRVGEYVRQVSLNSPGGSVQDALAIARLIREKELVTHVGEGNICASSCPLILAGGLERIAHAKAAIGVHQMFSGRGSEARNADLEVSGTQTLTAEVTRFLDEMGVDPAIWLHAMETPPQQLYYLTSEELTRYRLATEIAG